MQSLATSSAPATTADLTKRPPAAGLKRGFLSNKASPSAKAPLASHPPKHGRAESQPQSSVMRETVQERSTGSAASTSPQLPAVQRQPEVRPAGSAGSDGLKQVRFAGAPDPASVPARQKPAAPLPAPKRMSRFKARLLEPSDSESEVDADEVLSRLPDLDSEEEDGLCCGGACTHRARSFFSNTK